MLDQMWGDSNGDFIAEQGGSSIQVATPGTYVFVFNDQTLRYSITAVGKYYWTIW